LALSIGILDFIRHIQENWENVFPDSPFAYRFIDDELQDSYKGDQIRGSVFFLLSLLAIFTAFVGLFGLASYLATQRVKEIGIRKIHGATLKDIVFLITGDFLLLVLVASVPAFSLSWYVINQWLENFAFRTDMNYAVFFLSIMFTLLLTFVTTGLHGWRAGSVSPSTSLRSQ
jgi:putative ABC transport system permease protein